jgi:hypothetical protein
MPPPWRDFSKNRVGYFWTDFRSESKDDPTSAYGNDADLEKVAIKFQSRGIKVIYDLVINHKNLDKGTYKRGEIKGIWGKIPLENQRANLDYKKRNSPGTSSGQGYSAFNNLLNRFENIPALLTCS